jgi:hypothetical protein
LFGPGPNSTTRLFIAAIAEARSALQNTWGAKTHARYARLLSTRVAPIITTFILSSKKPETASLAYLA